MMKFLRGLFSSKELVYVAQTHEEYYRVIGKLNEANVKYTVKMPMNLNGPVGGWSSRDTQISFYEIYVKKDDTGKATRAIHSK